MFIMKYRLLLITFFLVSSVVHAEQTEEVKSDTTVTISKARKASLLSSKNSPKSLSKLGKSIYFGNLKSHAISPDKKYLIVGDTDGIVTVWDINNRYLIKRFLAHSEHVTSIAFHPAGNQFATGSSSSDGTIKIWSLKTFKHLFTIGKEFDDNEENDAIIEKAIGIFSLKYTHDGKQIVATVQENSGKNRLEVYDAKTGNTLNKMKLQSLPDQLHINPVTKKILFRNGYTLIQKSIDADTEEKRIELEFDIGTLVYSKDGKYIASLTVSRGCTAIWKSGDLTPVKISQKDIPEFTKKLGFDCYSQKQRDAIKLVEKKNKTKLTSRNFIFVDNTLIYFANDDKIEWWNIQTKQLEEKIAPFSQYINGLNFSPDSHLLAVGQSHGRIAFWDITKNELSHTWKSKLPYSNQNDGIQDIEYSYDGKQLAVLYLGNILSLFNAHTGKLINTLGNDIELFSLQPNGPVIAYISKVCHNKKSKYYCLDVWDYKNNKMILEEPLIGKQGYYSAIRFSPDGKMLAVSTYGNVIRVWNTQDWQLIKSIHTGQTQGDDSYYNIQFTPDNRYFFGSKVGHWVEKRTIKSSFFGNDAWEITKQFDGRIFDISRDGKSLAIADYEDNSLLLGKVSSWKTPKKINLGKYFEPYHLKFSPNGKVLAVAFDHGMIRLINTSTQKTIVNLISGPDGHWIKYTGDGKVWRTDTNTMVEVMPEKNQPQ